METKNQSPVKDIESVLREHKRRLVSIPGVVGAAQGQSEGKPCIKIYVSRKTPELMRKIPQNIEGYAVSIKESGEFRGLAHS